MRKRIVIIITIRIITDFSYLKFSFNLSNKDVAC